MKEKVTFQTAWIHKYGLRITARCPNTTEVMSAVCQFCETFGPDEDNAPERKRKRTQLVFYYKKPWRSDHMKRHCDTFHSSKFEEFNNLEMNEKKNIFWTKVEEMQ